MSSQSPTRTQTQSQICGKRRIAEEGNRAHGSPTHSLQSYAPTASTASPKKRQRLDAVHTAAEATSDEHTSPCRSLDVLQVVGHPTLPKDNANSNEAPARVIASPDIWDVLCSLVDDADDDANPRHDSSVRFDRAHDVDVVSWNRMDELMGTHEYGAWSERSAR